jgi:anti-anti-sigma regulatory factor
VEYLSSAGVGLLIDAAEHAEAHHLALQLQLAADGLVARLLTLAGLDTTLFITTDPAGVAPATGPADDRHAERLIADC